MQNANTILSMLNQKSQNDEHYVFQRIYRNLYNREFYVNAYARIQSKEGNMTEGVDNRTIDGFKYEMIDTLIEKLKTEQYYPKPVRRTYIPKKNGKTRPLGIPCFEDKLLQEVIRQLLESIYEPIFSDNSHGFRPDRSCHTALCQIKNTMRGANWVIEGDITGCFDNIDHTILLNILSQKIEDGRFIELIRRFLKAGYLEFKQMHRSLSGCPQGGIISPILSNIYLNEFALYTRSADQSFPYASFELGKMLRDGIGCSKNQQDSDRRFKDAFLGFVSLEEKSHDDKLQYRLGWMLLNGIGIDKNEARAKEYFEKAASVGNPFACYQLAKIIFSNEKAQPQDVEKALGYLRKAVEAENPYAAYFLGKLYEKGQHVPQNIAEAIKLYTLSAEQDNEFAAYRLGKLYLGGEGILKDVESAIRWLTFAADRKNQFAEYALGVLYFKGEDVPKDVPKALDYLKRSAGQGNQFAQYRLGKIYLMGEDVPKDIQTALQFLTAAAEQGNQYAQYTLGKLYLMGKDVPKNKETAVRWFTLSAAQGNIYAQFFLDHMDNFKDPSVLLAGTRLLHHMSRIFADNTPPLKPPGQRTDRKLLRKLREKKQAQGHARDDHEQTMSL